MISIPRLVVGCVRHFSITSKKGLQSSVPGPQDPVKHNHLAQVVKKKSKLRPWTGSAPMKEADASVTFEKPLPVVQPESPMTLTVAIFGPPNAGKSTLLNAIVGQKVSIVSPLAQTTREQVLGVRTQDNKQLVFIDTPGLMTKQAHEGTLVSSAEEAICSADVVMMVLDGANKSSLSTAEIDRAVEFLKKHKPRPILVLNKIDCVHSVRKLENRFIPLRFKIDFETVISLSALQGTNIDVLESWLFDQCKPGEWEYASEQVSLASKLSLVEEAIREQLFLRLKTEVPYQCTQLNRGWNQLENGVLRIDQIIRVPKTSQIKMVLGTGGSIIKAVAQEAQQFLQTKFGQRVSLVLEVKASKSKFIPKPTQKTVF